MELSPITLYRLDRRTNVRVNPQLHKKRSKRELGVLEKLHPVRKGKTLTPPSMRNEHSFHISAINSGPSNGVKVWKHTQLPFQCNIWVNKTVVRDLARDARDILLQ
jgi:hypothetical protein